MFLRLVLESFLRQRRRKLLAGLAVACGMAAVTAMVALGTAVGDKINRELRSAGANIVVYPRADTLEVNVDGVDLKPAGAGAYLDEADLPRIKGIFWHNNILGLAPMLDARLPVRTGAPNGPAVPETIVGTWFHHPLVFGTDRMTTGVVATHRWWRVDGAWPRDDRLDEVLAGRGRAQALGVRAGSTLYVGDGARPVRVVGVLDAAGPEDRDIVAPIRLVQELIGRPGAVRRVYVSALTKPEDAFARRDPNLLPPALRDRWYCSPYANTIAFQIQEALPHARAEQIRRVAQSEGRVLSRISGLMWMVSLAALAAAALAVSSAMANAILERRREIGLMRALGATRGAVVALFLAESVLLALVAGAVGFAIGGWMAQGIGRTVFGSGVPVEPVLIPVVLILAVLVTAAGSLPSIRQAVRLDPIGVLRGDA